MSLIESKQWRSAPCQWWGISRTCLTGARLSRRTLWCSFKFSSWATLLSLQGNGIRYSIVDSFLDTIVPSQHLATQSHNWIFYFLSISRFMSDGDRVSMVPRPRLEGSKTKTPRFKTTKTCKNGSRDRDSSLQVCVLCFFPNCILFYFFFKEKPWKSRLGSLSRQKIVAFQCI